MRCNEEITEKTIFKRPSKNLVLFLLFVTLAIILGPVRISRWNSFISGFDPYLNSEKLVQTSTVAGHMLSPNYRSRNYEDTIGSGYKYTVQLPSHLKYGGRVLIINDTGDYRIELKIWMMGTPFNPTLQLNHLVIGEYSGRLKEYISGVDKNGKPLGMDPTDNEESYQNWLMLYEKYNEQIREFFAVFEEVFGEDVLK
ncbi:MAG: hypothetical protein FWG91_02245 [Lachnospiraceae bacterium]|nr:hypothetical protein [Lachnospiraceae bacterium]